MCLKLPKPSSFLTTFQGSLFRTQWFFKARGVSKLSLNLFGTITLVVSLLSFNVFSSPPISEINGVNSIQELKNSPVDTLVLSIPSAEQAFTKRNLSLKIAKYNVNIATDNVNNARLWYNPNLYYQTTLYNQESHRFFSDYYPTSNYSDETIQIQELITLAGRHSATWQLAEVGIHQAQFQYDDLLRNLQYAFYSTISSIYYNQKMIAVYQYEIVHLNHLIAITKTLVEKGNASALAVIQLQAQLQDIITQELNCQNALLGNQQDFNVLLGNQQPLFYRVDSLPNSLHLLPTFQAVLDSAEHHRPDLKLAIAGIDYANKNLKLQKATALPDMTVGTTVVGTNSSGAVGYTGLFASMDLPVFNRNQYNILAAKDGFKQAVVNDSLMLATVRQQATGAYLTLLEVDKQWQKLQMRYGPNYSNDIEELIKNAFLNYENRRIDLLTLISYLGTYTDAKTNLLNLQVQYYNAAKNLNLNCASEMMK